MLATSGVHSAMEASNDNIPRNRAIERRVRSIILRIVSGAGTRRSQHYWRLVEFCLGVGDPRPQHRVQLTRANNQLVSGCESGRMKHKWLLLGSSQSSVIPHELFERRNLILVLPKGADHQNVRAGSEAVCAAEMPGRQVTKGRERAV